MESIDANATNQKALTYGYKLNKESITKLTLQINE